MMKNCTDSCLQIEARRSSSLQIECCFSEEEEVDGGGGSWCGGQSDRVLVTEKVLKMKMEEEVGSRG